MGEYKQSRRDKMIITLEIPVFSTEIGLCEEAQLSIQISTLTQRTIHDRVPITIHKCNVEDPATGYIRVADLKSLGDLI
jgi:hypothetical protein